MRVVAEARTRQSRWLRSINCSVYACLQVHAYGVAHVHAAMHGNECSGSACCHYYSSAVFLSSWLLLSQYVWYHPILVVMYVRAYITNFRSLAGCCCMVFLSGHTRARLLWFRFAPFFQAFYWSWCYAHCDDYVVRERLSPNCLTRFLAMLGNLRF